MPPGADPRDTLLPESLDQADARPVVTLPRAGVPGVVIAIGLAILAIALFMILDARRRALTAPPRRPAGLAAAGAFPAPPPLIVPPAPLPPPPVPVQIVKPVIIARAPPPPPAQPYRPAPTVYYPPPSPSPQQPPSGGARFNEPALVVDLGDGTAGGANANLAAEDSAVRATIIRNRGALVPQGSLIAAVLETPVNSSRPGFARAIVSRDVRGFDGTRVLIPRGSRLIGDFRADTGPGQKRVLVTWARLIRPDGVAIRLGSPATDALGGAGIAGRVDTHFLERFANAVLQSALTIGVNLASQSGGRTVILGTGGQLGTLGQTLIPNANPPPTIRVRAGTEIKVFVARDLDFGGVAPRQ
jgi:type IV secretion system protein VirB10